MPEQIRLKVGGETPQQIAVYEEFARNIPGFLPLSEPALPPGVAKPMAVSLQVYDLIFKPIECLEKMHLKMLYTFNRCAAYIF